MIEISEYTPDDRRAVIDLILDIQNNEFGIAITEEQQPDLQDIPSFYQHGKRQLLGSDAPGYRCRLNIASRYRQW